LRCGHGEHHAFLDRQRTQFGNRRAVVMSQVAVRIHHPRQQRRATAIDHLGALTRQAFAGAGDRLHAAALDQDFARRQVLARALKDHNIGE
jgi:hypothetical protein